MSLKRFMSICVALGSLAFTASAYAGPWGGDPFASPALGQNSAWGWTDGKNTSAEHFSGDPTINESGLYFNSTLNFMAEIGQSLSVTDTAQLNIDTSPGDVPLGAALTQFTVREWGTWNIPAGSGLEPQDIFTLQADVIVLRLEPFPGFSTMNIAPSVIFLPDGTWQTSGVLAAPLGGWEAGQFKVTNTLQVLGSAPLGSSIEKTGMQMIVPEPGTIGLLMMASGITLLRRRRAA